MRGRFGDAVSTLAILSGGVNKKERANRPARSPPALGLVFACATGEPLSRDQFSRRRLKPLLRRAELPEEFTLYTLRRTFATLATATGASRIGRSTQMGHANPDFTDEVYVTTLPSMQKSVSDALENLLFSETRTTSAHNGAEGVM